MCIRDSSGGNLELGKSAAIVAHENVRARLSQDNELTIFGMKSAAYPDHALPSVTYSQALTLHMNDEAVKLVHFPNSHTDGDTVLFLLRLMSFIWETCFLTVFSRLWIFSMAVT